MSTWDRFVWNPVLHTSAWLIRHKAGRVALCLLAIELLAYRYRRVVLAVILMVACWLAGWWLGGVLYGT